MKSEPKPESKSHAEAISQKPNQKVTEKAIEITETMKKPVTTTAKRAPLTDPPTKLLEAAETVNTSCPAAKSGQWEV